jgi:hypothetical protein
VNITHVLLQVPGLAYVTDGTGEREPSSIQQRWDAVSRETVRWAGVVASPELADTRAFDEIVTADAWIEWAGKPALSEAERVRPPQI